MPDELAVNYRREKIALFTTIECFADRSAWFVHHYVLLLLVSALPDSPRRASTLCTSPPYEETLSVATIAGKSMGGNAEQPPRADRLIWGFGGSVAIFERGCRRPRRGEDQVTRP